ncbi:twin-arginine translocation signal domain-containing protein [Calidifontibacter sp. DB0510]|uniref:Twin-arginine translocation signal domain-containing protein n=1 Tax=Metallococcus carri TaxID=1656884 RepID=A0A967B3P0_9MICO|nr:twin-arginine translocation signal domain-containing protein [Metallococcus carri]NHN56953.1 twin-arginine translocation signal domain-containing protein [Metallococcus carri]NOP37698.1 twin-arginine translocation signal domain-containing protein [Calidifontibacter sp. DB2511S]
MISRRHLLQGTAVAAGAAVTTWGGVDAAQAAPGRLTNLAHLRFLLDEVPLRADAVHTTWQVAQRPVARAPWTYADALPGGGWKRVGGGSYDPVTGHWGQGAYNADDIARAAVVFVRDWETTGSAQSRSDAVELLRTLTFLQDASGPYAGLVVLWLQADGTLTPSAQPTELPDPSDSDESYWVARLLWALGEAYAAFRTRDPAFAGFLRERFLLALGALEQRSLSRYGRWDIADDVRVPSWLIQDGADATAEAVLGLAAFATVDPQPRVRTALSQYAEGVAAMGSGGTGTWPFGAVLPWTHSQSLWHAWGGEAPQALCRASAVLGDGGLRQAALADVGSFTPVLLASRGPYNAWSPMPGEAQIAYGAEGRVSGLLAAADLTGSAGFLQLGGLAGGWFFGANPSGRPAYDPATGATVDGIEFDGRVNPNSGAESTIHGLLAMLALDAHPTAAALARSITGYDCAGAAGSGGGVRRARRRRSRGHATVGLDGRGQLVSGRVCRCATRRFGARAGHRSRWRVGASGDRAAGRRPGHEHLHRDRRSRSAPPARHARQWWAAPDRRGRDRRIVATVPPPDPTATRHSRGRDHHDR